MTKFQIYGAGAILATLASVGLLSMSGCADSSTPAGQAQIASTIQLGASTATSIGLVAIPDATEASAIATQAASILDTAVLPTLDGQVSGVTTTLNDILSLSAFDAPALAKAKLIIQSALPLLQAYLPADILATQLDKVPADVMADVRGFFAGVRQGITNYSGKSMDRGMNAVDFQAMRAKLAASPAVVVHIDAPAIPVKLTK